jgi:foldase protein PrsA
MTRQRRIPTPAWERDRGITGGLSGSRAQVLAIVGAALLVLAGLSFVGYGFLKNYLDDRNRPDSLALSAGGSEFSVRDFTNRTKMYVAQIGGTSNYQIIIPSVSQQLIEQGLLLKYAGEKNASSTDDEVKTQIAKLLGIDATDPNFDQRFKEELKSTGLSESQYRDMARAAVLKTKVTDTFTAELPAEVESLHYRKIVVGDQGTADNLKAQIEAGGDFAALAAANSTDTVTKDKGGDAGWVPKGYLAQTQDSLLFSLDLNTVVTQPGQNSVTIYQVTEKGNHAVDEDKKATLSNNNYRDWLTQKKDAESVVDEMDFTNGDTEKIRYVFDNAGLTSQ